MEAREAFEKRIDDRLERLEAIVSGLAEAVTSFRDLTASTSPARNFQEQEETSALASKQPDGEQSSGTSNPKPEDQIDPKTPFFSRRQSKRDVVDLGDQSDSDLGGWRRPAAARRDSLITDLPASTKEVVQHATVYRDQPKFDHIVLNYLSVTEVFKFLNEVHEYQQKNRLTLPAATLVAKKVRVKVMAKATHITSERQFFELSSDELMLVLQKAIKPPDRIAFAKALTTAAKFFLPDGFRLSVLNFLEFHTNLLIYKREFKDIYEFLAYKNESNVPRIDNKPEGVVNIFISKIPNKYGDKLFAQLTKTRFDSFDDFLDEFFIVVEEHAQISREARRMSPFVIDETKLRDDRRAPTTKLQRMSAGRELFEEIEDEQLEDEFVEHETTNPSPPAATADPESRRRDAEVELDDDDHVFYEDEAADEDLLMMGAAREPQRYGDRTQHRSPPGKPAGPPGTPEASSEKTRVTSLCSVVTVTTPDALMHMTRRRLRLVPGWPANDLRTVRGASKVWPHLLLPKPIMDILRDLLPSHHPGLQTSRVCVSSIVLTLCVMVIQKSC